jgi:DNA-directed RNA polymerase specialized sigma24 family protein
VAEEIALAMFERLVRLHQRMVLGTAYRLLGRMEDAQDAAQEVFLKLLQKHKQIEGDPSPGCTVSR